MRSVPRVLLARHGETAWNSSGRLQGHTDIALNDLGRAQARTLADAMHGAALTAVWTSDLVRARETGAIIATACGLAPPRVDPDLRERRFGVFEGLTRDEIAAQHPDAWHAWRARNAAPPGGEDAELVTARLTLALTRIADDASGPVLVVSHGGVMRLWMMAVTGDAQPLVPNCAVYDLAHDGTAFRGAALFFALTAQPS